MAADRVPDNAHRDVCRACKLIGSMMQFGADGSGHGLAEGSRENLAEYLGIQLVAAIAGELRTAMHVRRCLGAPDGHLHAASAVALAVESAGVGCLKNLPLGATGFATIELKSNHLSSPHDGWVDCVARAVHLGRTTQVWDAVVTHRETGKTVALFRCTQMLVYQK